MDRYHTLIPVPSLKNIGFLIVIVLLQKYTQTLHKQIISLFIMHIASGL